LLKVSLFGFIIRKTIIKFWWYIFLSYSIEITLLWQITYFLRELICFNKYSSTANYKSTSPIANYYTMSNSNSTANYYVTSNYNSTANCYDKLKFYDKWLFYGKLLCYFNLQWYINYNAMVNYYAWPYFILTKLYFVIYWRDQICTSPCNIC